MPSNAPRVLLIARASFAEPVLEQLRRDAITAKHATTATEFNASAFDVLVVDDELCDWRELLPDGVSVIVFASRADGETITAALAGGADDVITRGDRPHETVARIRALARRRPKPQPTSPTLRIGDIELDPESRRVAVDGKEVDLTRRQFDLLEFFLRNPGRVHTRKALLEHVWDMAAAQELNAVEIQVRRLREAIGEDLREPKRLRTVRGVGYLFER